jgi:WD40 repeat protein
LGDRIVTAGGVPRIWDATTGHELKWLYSSGAGNGGSTDWSPVGEHIVVGYTDGTARVWDALSGEVLLTFAGHTSDVTQVAWSADGKRIASSELNGVVKVWDAATGQELLSFTAPGATSVVDLSPDGKYVIAAGTYDTPVVRRVWGSTEELIAHARECCVTRELTRQEREQFGLPPR